MFIFGKTTTTTAATLALAFAGITTASASSDDPIAELVELNPGTSYTQMQADLSAYAEANNTTVHAVAQEVPSVLTTVILACTSQPKKSLKPPAKKGEHTQSHKINRNSVSAPSGSVLLNVKIDQATKDSVADWANENLLGRPYNSNFAVNKFGSFSALAKC